MNSIWMKSKERKAPKVTLTVMDGRQQDHEDEGDDRCETVCNHDHNHRTMCFSQSRCSQSLRTYCLHPRCMESWHEIGRSDRLVSFRVVDSQRESNKLTKKDSSTRSDENFTMAVFDQRPKCSSLFLTSEMTERTQRNLLLSRVVHRAWSRTRRVWRESDEFPLAMRQICPLWFFHALYDQPPFTTVPRQPRSQLSLSRYVFWFSLLFLFSSKYFVYRTFKKKHRLTFHWKRKFENRYSNNVEDLGVESSNLSFYVDFENLHYFTFQYVVLYLDILKERNVANEYLMAIWITTFFYNWYRFTMLFGYILVEDKVQNYITASTIADTSDCNFLRSFK